MQKIKINKLGWGIYKNGNSEVRINLIDGTKIRQTEDDEFDLAFAENIDLKITNRCTGTNCIMCHEGSSPEGKHGDIMSESFLKIVNTFHPFQEIAIGGGNVLEHPDLVSFLIYLKDRMVIANMTVHQKHFMENIDLIKYLMDEEYIHGLGISLTNSSEEFVEKVKQFPTAVIHVIAGVHKVNEIKKLYDKGLNILILGYKDLRRGHELLLKNHNWIQKKTRELDEEIMEMTKHFDHVAFDNLALEQLNMKEKLGPEKWERFYMGDEGTATFYIDAVTETFAESSTAPLDKRYSLMSSVDDMFNFVKCHKKER